MTPETWELVTEVLNAILDEPRNEAAILAANSEEVRAEVVRLLAAHREATESEPPKVIAGRYELQLLLGNGGSSFAWLGRDLSAGRQVVVKLPLQWDWYRPDITRQFESEAEILRGLNHPSIVTMIASGATAEGTPFLVMPYLEGASLRARLDQAPLSPESVASLVEQLGDAVEAAHQAGVIHRDIKPENIMLVADAGAGAAQMRPVLIDFGISQLSKAVDTSSTTRFFGTTRYMAPEQLMGKPVFASDVYALALVAFEMWTGQPLFRTDNPVELYMEQQRLSEAKLDSAAAAAGRPIPPSLRKTLWEGLRETPFRRPTAGQFARRLAQRMRQPGWMWRPTRRAAIAMSAIAIPGAGWLAYENRPIGPAERSVHYKAGQTFEAVGWRKAGKIDLDITVVNDDGTHILGNRLVSASQGAYFHRLTPRVRREGLRRAWRLTGAIMPVSGAIGIGVCLREAGKRFYVEAEGPDRDDSTVAAFHAYVPRVDKMSAPFHFERNRFYLIEMTFDPSSQSARVAVDGRVVHEGYRGTEEFMEIPGVAIGFGVYQSTSGEAVFGDITFEMD